MIPAAILDTGPLVALLNARDMHHDWTIAQMKNVAGPLLTCESVLSETVFLLRSVVGGTKQLTGMLRSGGLQVSFDLASETAPVCVLLAKYDDVPMSLADACLVRMSEIFPKHRVMTLDSDFRQYRRNRRQSIPIILPLG